MRALSKALRFSTSSFLVRANKASQVQVQRTSVLRPMPDLTQPLTFGKHIADHMLEVGWTADQGWGTPSIKPYEPLQLDPAVSSLHYAVECYEELEAVRGAEGQIFMFRPELYMKRLAEAAEAVCLPTFPPAELTSLIKKMISLDANWVPAVTNSGLYVRVNFFSDHNVLGVTRPLKAKLTAYSTPHSSFSPSGLHPVRLFCDETVVRTWPGGVGQFKAGANYVNGVMHTDRIRKQGYQHMLWTVSNFHLDGNVTEAGRMNFFVVVKSEDSDLQVITPPLNGLIIPGITRDSVLELVKDLPQYEVVERALSVEELLKALQEKRVVECFGTGSRMFVVPVQTVHIRGKDYEVPLKLQNCGRLAKWVHDHLKEIQSGAKQHPWAEPVSK